MCFFNIVLLSILLYALKIVPLSSMFWQLDSFAAFLKEALLKDLFFLGQGLIVSFGAIFRLVRNFGVAWWIKLFLFCILVFFLNLSLLVSQTFLLHPLSYPVLILIRFSLFFPVRRPHRLGLILSLTSASPPGSFLKPLGLLGHRLCGFVLRLVLIWCEHALIGQLVRFFTAFFSFVDRSLFGFYFAHIRLPWFFLLFRGNWSALIAASLHLDLEIIFLWLWRFSRGLKIVGLLVDRCHFYGLWALLCRRCTIISFFNSYWKVVTFLARIGSLHWLYCIWLYFRRARWKSALGLRWYPFLA